MRKEPQRHCHAFGKLCVGARCVHPRNARDTRLLSHIFDPLHQRLSGNDKVNVIEFTLAVVHELKTLPLADHLCQAFHRRSSARRRVDQHFALLLYRYIIRTAESSRRTCVGHIRIISALFWDHGSATLSFIAEEEEEDRKMARKEREADAVEWRACVHEKGARGRAHVVCVGVCAFFFPLFFPLSF